jgi:hypothetical protein
MKNCVRQAYTLNPNSVTSIDKKSNEGQSDAIESLISLRKTDYFENVQMRL